MEPSGTSSSDIAVFAKPPLKLERRNHARVALRVTVTTRVFSATAPPLVLVGQSTDVGLGGMRLFRFAQQDEPRLHTDSIVLVSFDLPTGAVLCDVPCSLVFEVVQGKRHNVRMSGLSILSLHPNQEAALKTFLRSQKKAKRPSRERAAQADKASSSVGRSTR